MLRLERHALAALLHQTSLFGVNGCVYADMQDMALTLKFDTKDLMFHRLTLGTSLNIS
jgi:hypothetical protein